MSAFDNQNLFRSGPHAFQVGGMSLRHVLHNTPGGQGVRLSDQGRHGRSITQFGDLIGDDPAALQTQIEAIEAKLDGRTHLLIDDVDRRWEHVVMLSFEPESMRRVGSRWRMPYQVTYLQLKP